jgi:hypothetical protein
MPAVGPRDALARRGIADHQLEGPLAKRKLHASRAGAVSSGVGEGLLQDSECGLVDAALELPRFAFAVDAYVVARRAVACDERVERREPGWRIHGAVRRTAVAKRPDDLVDLTDGLARQLLDCFQRRL